MTTIVERSDGLADGDRIERALGAKWSRVNE